MGMLTAAFSTVYLGWLDSDDMPMDGPTRRGGVFLPEELEDYDWFSKVQWRGTVPDMSGTDVMNDAAASPEVVRKCESEVGVNINFVGFWSKGQPTYGVSVLRCLSVVDDWFSVVCACPRLDQKRLCEAARHPNTVMWLNPPFPLAGDVWTAVLRNRLTGFVLIPDWLFSVIARDVPDIWHLDVTQSGLLDPLSSFTTPPHTTLSCSAVFACDGAPLTVPALSMADEWQQVQVSCGSQ